MSSGVIEGVVVCPAIAASCACRLQYGTGGPHECDCGGQWHGSEPDITPVRFPLRRHERATEPPLGDA